MGLYDTFVYNCSYCGKETNSQTKLGECVLTDLEIGDEFPRDGKILMKNPCEHCDKYNTVVIVDGIITEFTQGEEAVFDEGYWGGIEKLEDANEEDKN